MHSHPAPQVSRIQCLSDVRRVAGSILGVDGDCLEAEEAFGNLGFDSALLVSFAERLSEQFGTRVDAVLLFTYPTLTSLCDYLVSQGPQDRQPEIPVKVSGEQKRTHSSDRDIAVIGISCRLPGADSKERFWTNQVRSLNCIREVPHDRWDPDAIFGDPLRDNGRTDVKWAGFIEGEDLFSPEFFGISNYEAGLMDPQHRLFLKAAWESIWDAGYDPKGLAGRPVGVFAGVQFQDYQKLLSDRGVLSAQACTGNAHAMLANRVSFLLDLHGPSAAIDTACSSSLVAIHSAVQAIRQGECELALAGGVNLLLAPDLFIMGRQLGVLSPTGQCRTFDAAADGYVRAEGVGVLLLKPLKNALKDRDHVYGVIAGTALNHGGKAASLTAPNSRAHTALVVSAVRDAGLSANAISYVEMHGTGTELGDPIEVEGVKAAFRTLRAEDGLLASPCAIGSVKTNIGHLEPAAGVAGVINVLMSMRARSLPGLSNFDTLNPHILLDEGLFLQSKPSRWDVGDAQRPRAAIVNSFGFGGANASVVIREVPNDATEREADGEVFIPISASDPNLIRIYARELKQAISDEQAAGRGSGLLRDVAFTLQRRGDARPFRAVIRASNLTELKERLESLAAGRDEAAFLTNAQSGPDRLAVPPHVAEWLELGAASWPDLPDSYCRPLPVTPWADRSCWFEQRTTARLDPTGAPRASLSFLEPAWTPAIADGSRPLHGKCIWIIGRSEEQAEAFADLVRNVARQKVTVVTSVLESGAHDPEPSLEIWNRAGDQPDFVVVLPAFDEAAAHCGDETRILFELAKELSERSFAHVVDVYYVAPQDFGMSPDFDALPAFAKSAFLENQRLRIHTLFFGKVCRSEVMRLVASELAARPSESALTIRYAPARSVLGLRKLDAAESTASHGPWLRQNGVYLIPGGTGELGYRLLEKLVQETDATFVTAGRSALRGEIADRVNALAAKAKLQGGVRYIQCDIANLDQARQMVAGILATHGQLNGILNLVTAHDDAFLFNKSWEEFAAVSAGKVTGTRNLDLASAQLDLDFFVTFSSLASLGLAGASDYAYGCAFQNAFMEWRDREVAAGRRAGVSKAVCWSRWKWDKYVSEDFDAWFASLGFEFLDTGEGVRALRETLVRRSPQLFVVYGRPDRIFEHLDISTGLLRSQPLEAPGGEELPPPPTLDRIRSSEAGARMTEAVSQFAHRPIESVDPGRPEGFASQSGGGELEGALSATVKELLKLDELDPRSTFASIGLDSVMAIRLIILIEQRFSTRLTPKQLLSHDTVAELASHLRALTGSAPEGATGNASDDVTDYLASCLRRILKADEIPSAEPFANMGVDSILAVKLASEFDRRFGVGISPRWFAKFPTVETMAQEIERKRAGSA